MASFTKIGFRNTGRETDPKAMESTGEKKIQRMAGFS
jgi:hypothetical protein